MEGIEIIDSAKDAKGMAANCCVSDVWFVGFPE